MNTKEEKSQKLSNKKMKLLIVDDDKKSTLYLVEDMKLSYGHSVLWLQEASKVIETLTTESFDAVILDLMMPIPDGWADFEKRRSEEGKSTGNVLFTKIREILPELPVLVYTAKTELGIKENPFTRCLSKPEFFAKINDELQKLLSHENNN